MNKFFSKCITFLLICTLPYLKMVGVIDWNWWIVILPLILIITVYVLIVLSAMGGKNKNYQLIMEQQYNEILKLEKEKDALMYMIKKLRRDKRKD